MREILPLGSVVTLKNASKRLMIIGRIQKETSTKQVFDYCGVLWPEGLISSDKVYLFNEDDIQIIWFIGLQDSEEFAFRSELDRVIDELN